MLNAGNYLKCGVTELTRYATDSFPRVTSVTAHEGDDNSTAVSQLSPLEPSWL